MEALLQWVSVYFTVDMYHLTTKVQGILWSVADIVVVYYFLKLTAIFDANHLRAPITKRYALLWLSALLTPLLLFARTQHQYFILDAVICGIQYLILLYTLVVSGHRMMHRFMEMLRSGSMERTRSEP